MQVEPYEQTFEFAPCAKSELQECDHEIESVFVAFLGKRLWKAIRDAYASPGLLRALRRSDSGESLKLVGEVQMVLSSNRPPGRRLLPCWLSMDRSAKFNLTATGSFGVMFAAGRGADRILHFEFSASADMSYDDLLHSLRKWRGGLVGDGAGGASRAVDRVIVPIAVHVRPMWIPGNLIPDVGVPADRETPSVVYEIELEVVTDGAGIAWMRLLYDHPQRVGLRFEGNPHLSPFGTLRFTRNGPSRAAQWWDVRWLGCVAEGPVALRDASR